MIYQCQDTFLHLGRIVAVSGVSENRMSSTAEARFQVIMSGANHAMYFLASERSAKATVILRHQHHQLLSAWQDYRAAKSFGQSFIYDFGNLRLNLFGICAVTDMELHKIGMSGYSNNSTPAYSIYLLGLNDPIKRRLHETGHQTADELALERDLLLDAWRSIETVGTA